MDWARILPIIVGNILQNPAQMRLPKYDHMIETFPSDRNGLIANTHGP